MQQYATAKYSENVWQGIDNDGEYMQPTAFQL